jgi:hypothetical protein
MPIGSFGRDILLRRVGLGELMILTDVRVKNSGSFVSVFRYRPLVITNFCVCYSNRRKDQSMRGLVCIN